jgi:hypothetical protein
MLKQQHNTILFIFFFFEKFLEQKDKYTIFYFFYFRSKRQINKQTNRQSIFPYPQT